MGRMSLLAEGIERSLAEAGGAPDTHAATELKLWIDNDQMLHKSLWQDYYKNLTVKIAQGKYNRDAAVKLFVYLADRAAQSYTKQHGGGSSGFGIFSKPTREAVAKELRDDFENEFEGAPEQFTQFVPKKYAGAKLSIR